MSVGGGERSPGPTGPAAGRRGNGLPAASWAPVGDVDPRQAGDLLLALADAGIAAYVTPSTGSVGAYLAVQLPARPLDRLHVDAARRLDAVALVRAELAGERAPSAEDEAFAAIVSGWDAPSVAPVEPWPVAEDTGPEDPARAAGPRPGPSGVVVRPARRRDDEPGPPSYPPAGRDPLEGMHTDEEEHYVAPPPPPLPRWQRPTLISVVALVLGLAVLGWTSVSARASQLSLLTGVLLVAGGTGGLISRLRDAGEGDGDDDGAVV